MIQINLIPDVKLEYLRARRMRNTTISVSIIAGLAAGAVVVVAILFLLVQVGLEKLADGAITSEYDNLSKVEGLSELRTLQNQLSIIPGQHENRSMDSRLFSVMQAINPPAPNDVSFTSVDLDPSAGLLTLEGVTENGYTAVEVLKKTIASIKLEYRQSTESESTTTVAIADEIEVGETSFGQTSDGKRVLRFKLTMKYPKELFTNKAKSARIITPTDEIDVTDSRVQVPDDLFSTPARDESEDK